jgi:hypothetical protein
MIGGEARLFKAGGRGAVRLEGGVGCGDWEGARPFPQYVEFRVLRKSHTLKSIRRSTPLQPPWPRA